MILLYLIINKLFYNYIMIEGLSFFRQQEVSILCTDQEVKLITKVRERKG